MNRLKIIVVDDELTCRNTIKKLLQDSRVYEVAQDFSDGKMALDWLRKNTADIMICDMKMTGMDGLELMRNVRIIDEYLPIIVVSGFDDFNYVRGSLNNWACNYLLKHEITGRQLLNVLDQVRERYRLMPTGDAVYYKRGYCIYDAKSFHADHINRLIEQKHIEFTPGHVASIAISPDYRFKKGIHAQEYRKDVVNAIIDMLNQLLADQYPYLIYITQKGHVIPVISFRDEKSTLLMVNIISNLVRRLQNQIVRMLDITVTIVIGDVQRELQRGIDQALRMDDLLADKLYLGGNRTMSEAVTKKIAYSDDDLPDTCWNQLYFELKNRMDGYIWTVRDLLDEMEKRRLRYDIAVGGCRRIVELIHDSGILDGEEADSMLNRLRLYEEFAEMRSMIMETLNRKSYMNDKIKAAYSPQVVQALEYIEKHYMNDISLEKCAEMTGTSYAYLSRTFKKETGKRFVEFLNRRRVDQAKCLLVRKDMSMKQIADLTGFRNYNYFFKVFKEVEGVTPGEFLTKN